MRANLAPIDEFHLQSGGDASIIPRLLEDARKRLVETGTRNRLVHVNRGAKRANVVNIVDERSNNVFDILWSNAKRMAFAPLLPDAEGDAYAEGHDAGTPQLDVIVTDGDKSRFRDNHFDVRLTPDRLQKQLLRLSRDAHTAESEQGVNILYLALGFLTWFEDRSSSVQREAPLILLPVELKRNSRTSTYDLVRRDDDLATNLPLKERLQKDFGIVLPEIADEDGWTPGNYFDRVEEAVKSYQRWSIDRDGMQLGFFSFSKFLMLRDLDPRNWPNGGLASHALVSGLLAKGFAGEPPLFADGENLDARLDPADIIQVIDADASQTKVIEQVRAGRNLVVQGPPGTGKSQTITNIIAAAVHDGKRVLFVAEKMAALGVVHSRLVKVGLRDICLELHSRSANKKSVLREFERTLKSGAAIPAMPSAPNQLKDARDQLNGIAHLLHLPINGSGETPFSVISEQAKYAGSGAPPPFIAAAGLDDIDRAQADEIASNIETYAGLLAREGPDNKHPFRGVRNLSLQPTDLQRACERADALARRCERVAADFGSVATNLGWQAEASFESIKLLQNLLAFLPKAPSKDPSMLRTLAAGEQTQELTTAIEDGVRFQAAWREISSNYSGGALHADIVEWNGATNLGVNVFKIAAEIEACPELINQEGSTYNCSIQVIRDASLLGTNEYRNYDAAADQFAKVAAYLGWPADASFDAILALQALLARLKDAPSVEPSFLRSLAVARPTEELWRALETGIKFQEMWREISSNYSAGALDADIGGLRTAIQRGGGSFLARLGPQFRSASTALDRLLTSPSPRRAEDRLVLLDALAAAQRLRAAVRAKATMLKNAFGSHWLGESSAFKDAISVVRWAAELSKLLLSINLASAAELATDPQKLKKVTDYFANVASALDAMFQQLSETFNLDAKAAYRSTALKRVSIVLVVGSEYGRASEALDRLLATPLPRSAAARSKLFDALRHAQRLHSVVIGKTELLETVLKSHWRHHDTDFAEAMSILRWLEELSELGFKINPSNAAELALNPRGIDEVSERFTTEGRAIDEELRALDRTLDLDARVAFGVEPSRPFTFFAARFGEMAAARDRYDGWRSLQQSRAKLFGAQLDALVTALDSGTLPCSAAVTEFRYARAEAIWRRARKSHPDLERLDSFDRHELVSRFQQLDRQRLVDVKTLILANHLESLPQGAVGQMGIIRGELAKQRGHKPIRTLVVQASEAIQRIKPVFLMSPVSVAQYLPPGKIEFDLLVIDEASQVRPEDALGAIARCKQIVVVGDQKQLPPTAFFDRLTSNDDISDEDGEEDPLGGAARATELESVLSLCEARGLPSRMLTWHYRSRDPSLIAVSNAEFYDHKLILPPSPLQHDPSYGLKFTRVNGAYDRGGRRTNTIEAHAIVGRVIEHSANKPHLSLGVVAFSSAQRSAIEELLEFERRRNNRLDEFLREGKSEDVIVKNIENVQGDERDVILISVGYGPEQPGGRLSSMNFGPVNRDGGERRLNVLFTRARLHCEVFASFDPGDIETSRTTATGPRVLKRYLEFARTGILDEKQPSGLGADSPFEEDVGEVIRGLGYEVDHQVGSAGFRIDLGVRNRDRPGQYILAVECDGATYHSALWARERDRLRQGVLESLDWRFHRIWSTDWFYRRDAEIARLRRALEDACSRSESSIARRGANADAHRGGLEEPSETAVGNQGHADFRPAFRQYPAYERFNETVSSSVEPHEADLRKLAELVFRIVHMEGPIHQDEVARRLATSFGKERTGGRISDAASRALRLAKRGNESELLSDGQFWFTAQQAEAPPIRDRSREIGTLLKAAYIAPMEIAAALDAAQNDGAGASEDDLVRGAINLMGFKRSGPELTARFKEILNSIAG